jgi:hypothetical protein
LARLALDDPDEAVRSAALAHLHDVDQLLTLLTDRPDATGLIDRLLNLDATLASTKQVVFAALLRNNDEDSNRLLIASTSDPELIASACVDGPADLSDTLLERARGLGEACLVTLEKRSRNRAKKINRFARNHIEQMRTLTSERAGHIQKGAEAVGKIDQLPGDSQARFAYTLKSLEAAREGILSCNNKLRSYGVPDAPIEDLDQALTSLRQVKVQPEPAVNPTPEPEQAPPQISPYQALVDQICEIEKLIDPLNVSEHAAACKSLSEQWLTLADTVRPTDVEKQAFEGLTARVNECVSLTEHLDNLSLPDTEPFPDVWPDKPEALQDLLRNLATKQSIVRSAAKNLARLAWPQDVPCPAALGHFQTALKDLQVDVERGEEQLNRVADSLEEAVKAIDVHLDNGELKGALSAQHNARQIERCLPPDFSHPARGSLKKTQRRISELKDWQKFATSPKRQTILEAIEALADQPLSPPDQAERIKTLRSEWKSLGAPGNAQEFKQADQFNAAAERAFEPCRAYFAEAAEQRAFNLQARCEICDQIEAYLANIDWENADLKAADKIMRTAREEWQRFHPVDKRHAKPVEVRFEEAQKSLHERIKAAGLANLERKKVIVEEARAVLDDGASMADRINRIKTLQAQWKVVGPTPRGPDQELWKAFREVCNAVFEQRIQEKEEADQRANEATAAARNLITHIDQILSAPSLDDADIKQIRSQAADLTSLPAAAHVKLQDALRSLDQRRTEQKKVQKVKSRLQDIANIKALDVLLSEHEIAGTQIDSEALTQANVASVFANRTTRDGDVFERCREMTISAELIAGMESPEEDADLRLRLQVELLKAHVGQNQTPRGVDDLVRQWCEIGGKTSATAPLRERMFNAVKHLVET